MTRDEALKHFDENYVQIKSIEKIEELKKYYESNKEKLADDFVQSFKKICIKIRDMQVKREKDKIGYINYSMLRTNILEKKHLYLVDAFDKYWYFDLENCRVEYDAAWTFSFLDKLQEELEEKRKRYINKILESDIEKIILKEAGKYNKFVIDLAKYAMPKALKLTEYNNIFIDEVFEVRVGEYRATSKVVYEEKK